jgi:hypothetical protein
LQYNIVPDEQSSLGIIMVAAARLKKRAKPITAVLYRISEEIGKLMTGGKCADARSYMVLKDL